MKLIKKLLIAVPLILILCSGYVLAENNVSEIDISVTVRNDGSAYVVQNWKGDFYEGTENYIPINTDGIEISNFTVSDVNGTYDYENNWNINANFEEKAMKCGINETADGIELCFGISKYGENRYAIEYVVKDFIKSYTDYDGTNFMFINPNMSTFPTDGHINIVMEDGTELDENNAGIWAFGYDGNIEFQNGTINAWTKQKLDNDACMIVMLQLNKGIIHPQAEVNKSFETVKETAFEGSDYNNRSDDDKAGGFLRIIGFIVKMIVFILVIVVVVFLIIRKKAIKAFYKKTQYFRDIPNGGKIEISHYLAQNFDVVKEESLIIGALILSMINKGSLEPQIDESVGLFGKVKESVNIKLIKEPDTPAELSLYNLLLASAGDDGILQEKELADYSYKHPEKIKDFIKSVKKSGESEFISLGGFSDGPGNCIKDLSDKGKTELAELMGLKKYLKEFTLIAERGISETIIWKEYMVYATLFGIEDKVIKQLEKVYPEKMPEFESYNRNVIIAGSFYHSMHSSSQRAMRESGGGGQASFGGGGGFSGGGSGGGSR